ncbi:MAG: hypothetical protein ACOYL6_19410 [Bacteriovoracaceae bacterium]
MSSYSEGFKKALILKSLQSHGPSLAVLAKENGLPLTTVYCWKRKYAKNSIMRKSNEFGPEEKLKILIETASLSEQELGEYIRKKGLYSTDLDSWKKEIISTFKKVGRPKIDPEISQLKKEKKDLEKDLTRKNKALAEMSARVILLKKTQALFGESEEDE